MYKQPSSLDIDDNETDEFITCNNHIIDGDWKSIDIHERKIIINILDDIIVNIIKSNKKVKFTDQLVSNIHIYETNSKTKRKNKKRTETYTTNGLVRQNTKRYIA